MEVIMSERIDATTRTNVENNVVLISKIYESFEALEETLGKLKLEEPLFITYVAKKTFANAVFKNIEKDNKTLIN